MAFVTKLSSIPGNAEASQIIPTVNSVIAQINTLIVNPLNEVIYPTIPSAPVNLLGVTVGNTGNPVFLTPDGPSVDTNAGLIVAGRGSGVLALGGTTSANASLRVVNLTNAANFLQVTGATSAAATVAVAAVGATTDINLTLAAAGAGTVGITGNTTITGNLAVTASGSILNGLTSIGGTTSATASLRVVGVTNAANFLQVTGATSASPTVTLAVAGATTNVVFNIASAGSGAVALQTAAGTHLTLSQQGATADTNIFMQGATAAQDIVVGITGTQANMSIQWRTAGSGVHKYMTRGTTQQFQVSDLQNAANYLTVTGATSAAPSATLGCAGSSAEVFLSLSPKGTSSATVQFGNATCFQANGTQLNLLASLGPANSHSDIQKWLRIVDQAGTSLFIPCY